MKTIIVGAGGFGRELLDWCHTHTQSTCWPIEGFIDDVVTEVTWGAQTYPVISKIIDYVPDDDVQLLLAIACPKVREKIYIDLKNKNATFATYIHSNAYISQTATIGKGSIIGPFASISVNASVGICSVLNFYANVGHDASLGDFSVMSVHANINGFSRVGSCVFIGGHGVVLPSVFVANGATIAAGSTVMRRVRENATVIGVPAEQFMS